MPLNSEWKRILDDLNNNNNSYLLVTKFTNPNGTGTWQTVSAANLSACGLKVPSPAPSANRIAGVSTNSSSSSVALPSDPSVTYSLVSFNPPSGATAPASGCNMFGNLAGGRARMTVRGTVQRNGAIVASFDSTRDVFIRTGGAPAAENNLGLVITGAPSASKTGSPFHIVYDQNGDGAIGTSGSSFTEPLGNVNCILCTSPSDLNTGGTSLGSVITGPIPNFPTVPESHDRSHLRPTSRRGRSSESRRGQFSEIQSPIPTTTPTTTPPPPPRRGSGGQAASTSRAGVQCRDRLQARRNQGVRLDQDPCRRAAGQAVPLRRLRCQRRE